MLSVENIRRIYNSLADDESKRIYIARLVYSMTGDDRYLIRIINDYREKVLSSELWKSFVEKVKNDKSPKYIFGCGEYGKRLFENTKECTTWKGFIDHAINHIIGFEDVYIFPFDEINFEIDANYYLPSKAYYCEMYNELLAKGVKSENIIDATVLYDITEGLQYFDLKELPRVGNEVFVDCGACDGMSSVSFINWCNSNYELICFEPDDVNIDKIKRNFTSRDITNYKIIDKGLWSHKTVLNFCSNGNANSCIYEGEFVGANVVKLDVTSMDEELMDTPVSFIKMDIEGSELETIKGAKNIIKEHKPKLAICIYHKNEDIWQIPITILRIRNDYKFYIRHYSFGHHETVLYGI